MNKIKILKLAGAVGANAKTSDRSILDSAKAFVRMLIDTVAGKYKPKKRNLVIGSLVIAYVLSPIDLIPAFLLDDVAIVFIALKYFRREIDNYLAWENTRRYKTVITDAEIVHEK